MDGYFPDPVRVVVHGRGASRTEAVPGVVGLATDHSYIRLDQFGWEETENMGQVEAARAVEPSTGSSGMSCAASSIMVSSCSKQSRTDRSPSNA